MAATGVTFCTVPCTSFGESVASGLVLALGKFDYVIDNASCFAGSSFPADSSILLFGDLPVYVATMTERFPWEIVSFAEPLPPAGSALVAPGAVEVMMAVSSNSHNPPLERDTDQTGPSTPMREKGAVDEVIEELREPVHPWDDPEEAMAKIKAARERLLQQVQGLASTKYRMESNIREYNRAHGLTPANEDPSRLGSVQRRGGELGTHFEHDLEPTSRTYFPSPVYDTTVKNVLAARAVAEDQPHQEGDEMLRQFQRVQHLLRVADEQAEAARIAFEAGAGSRGNRSARDSRGGPCQTEYSASPGQQPPRSKRRQSGSSQPRGEQDASIHPPSAG